MKSILLTMALVFAVSVHATEKKTFHTKEYKEHHSKGLKRNAKKLKELKAKAKKHKAFQGVAVPAKTDLSALVSPPENQGNCGSCWDFGITKSLRSAYMLSGNDPGRLAFNFLLNNCGKGPSQSGCNGGDFDAGESFLNGGSPWLEAKDPYTQNEGRCANLSAASEGAITYDIVGDGNSAPTFQDLSLALSQKHMLVVDVAVCGQWESYAGGIFNRNQCGPSSINHIINMTGYDCETSVDAAGNCQFNSKGQPVHGDGYLIAMNNWGENWGEKGYMRTRWGIDAVANTAMYFTVKAPAPPVPPVPPTPVPVGTPVWLWFVLGGVGVVGLVVLVGMVRG